MNSNVATPGHHNILNPKPLRIPVLAMILPVVGLRHLCAEEALIFYLKSICGNEATRHLQLNIHFNLRSTYTYTYTYTFSQKKRYSYGLIRTFHAASGVHLSSVLFARWAPRIKSWTFWRGSWHWSYQRKGPVAMTFLFNPLNAVMQALKLKISIFTDFHPVLLQVGVEMLYLLAILGGFWKLELIQR